jgi:hypothetical protein
LIHFCTAHPQQFRNVFFGPENRNGIRAGQYINDIGGPLFGRFVQLFFDVAEDEGLPSRNDIVVAHTWLLGHKFFSTCDPAVEPMLFMIPESGRANEPLAPSFGVTMPVNTRAEQ